MWPRCTGTRAGTPASQWTSPWPSDHAAYATAATMPARKTQTSTSGRLMRTKSAAKMPPQPRKPKATSRPTRRWLRVAV